ncbi:MAG: class I SAM-dependent methyltransferase [Bdellovibrionia bacterium]
MSLTKSRMQLVPILYDALQWYVHRDHGATISAVKKFYDAASSGGVLEIGCGTGTISNTFRLDDYLGVDTDSDRISLARSRYPGRRFEVADASSFDSKYLSQFGFLFVHGVIHHLSDSSVHEMFLKIGEAARLRGTPIQFLVLEPILPRLLTNPIGWFLAKMDRGQWVRTHEEYLELFGEKVSGSEIIPYNMRWPVARACYLLKF